MGALSPGVGRDGRCRVADTMTIDVSPDPTSLTRGVRRWGRLLQDHRPLWADIREVYDRHQRRHFDTEGAATGARWPDNSEPTVPIVPGGGPYDAWKQRIVPGAPTLVFTGRLREAATGGAGSLQKQTPTEMEMGIDAAVVPYAADHHFGNAVESRLFQRTVQLKQRPVIRMAGSVLGTKSVFDRRTSRGTFGYAVRQLVQAHVVRERRRAMGHDTSAADRTIRTIISSGTR